jgi:hypothetical protein
MSVTSWLSSARYALVVCTDFPRGTGPDRGLVGDLPSAAATKAASKAFGARSLRASLLTLRTAVVPDPWANVTAPG